MFLNDLSFFLNLVIVDCGMPVSLANRYAEIVLSVSTVSIFLVSIFKIYLLFLLAYTSR